MKKKKIALIGLGYVGLPLALEFGKKREVIGFDTNRTRINQLRRFEDSSKEFTAEDIKKASNLFFTSNIEDLAECTIFIITVPTPVNANNIPDLNYLKKSIKSVATVIKRGDIVIFESTVYPGTTEEICAPALEKKSGLVFNEDFFCGYSPERINPGDKFHQLNNVIKITSGSTPEIAREIDSLYKEIITAGTFLTSSIKIAEAAKVIENTQRDVNIALVNELAIIFNKLNIDTQSVLEAANTKWNFLEFWPGLVGGHCIGVDPYYLAYKAIETGYKPEMILAGRRLNNSMSNHIFNQVLDLMREKKIKIQGSRILIMGLTFKENCSDIRNTRIIDIFKEFKNLSCNVDIYDPYVNKAEAKEQYDVNLITNLEKNTYDAILLAVAHEKFKKLSPEKIKSYGKKVHVLYDIKYLLNSYDSDGRL